MDIFRTETPPRTWGRQSSRISGNAERRNTPTHVGKTKSKKVKKSHKRKHPHARGEDYLSVCTVLLMLETPPRTWGRLCYGLSVVHAVGNTPTHVGKTSTPFVLFHGLRKHPHARGEDSERIL